MRKLFIIAIVLGFGMLFSSCAKFPQAEIDATTAAVQELKTANADLFVPEAYQAVVDSLNLANAKAVESKGKLFKTYKTTKALLVKVDSMVVNVKTKNEAKKAEVKAETDSLIVEVKGLVELNKGLVVKAPRGKEGRSALEAINNEISVVEGAVIETDSLLNAGNLFDANQKIKAAKEKATATKDELEKAIKKVRR